PSVGDMTRPRRTNGGPEGAGTVTAGTLAPGDGHPRHRPAPSKALAGCQDDAVQRLDLLITGASVVDGTGAPAFEAAVGVLPPDPAGTARLALLRDPGQVDVARGTARRSFDATGKVVAPGFIDLHSHSGLMILAEPGHEPKVRQGVTTEVVGVDGLSYAPMPNPDRLAELVEMNGGLDGLPDLDFGWDSVESYLDRFD